jgi:hypothetical protein
MNRKTEEDPVTVVMDLGDIIGMARSAGLQLPAEIRDKWVVVNVTPEEVDGLTSDLRSGGFGRGKLPGLVSAIQLEQVAAEEWVDRHRDDY